MVTVCVGSSWTLFVLGLHGHCVGSSGSVFVLGFHGHCGLQGLGELEVLSCLFNQLATSVLSWFLG